MQEEISSVRAHAMDHQETAGRSASRLAKGNGMLNPGDDVEDHAAGVAEVLAVEGGSPDTLLDDPMRLYLREIGRYRLLSGHEEVEYARAMRLGDEEAERAQKQLSRALKLARLTAPECHEVERAVRSWAKILDLSEVERHSMVWDLAALARNDDDEVLRLLAISRPACGCPIARSTSPSTTCCACWRRMKAPRAISSWPSPCAADSIRWWCTGRSSGWSARSTSPSACPFRVKRMRTRAKSSSSTCPPITWRRSLTDSLSPTPVPSTSSSKTTPSSMMTPRSNVTTGSYAFRVSRPAVTPRYA